MKKIARKGIVAVLALCLSLTLLVGCGSSYTARELVEDTLNLYYLDQPSEAYMMMLGLTEDEAHQRFEDWLNMEIPFFCGLYEVELDSCEPQIEPQIAELYHKIYAHSKFEVGETTKTGDDYSVSVTIWPIDILQKVYDNEMEGFAADLSEKIASGNYDALTDEEFETLWAQGVIDLVNAHLDELDYLEAQTMEIRVEKDSDNVYSVNVTDFQNADELILAY